MDVTPEPDPPEPDPQEMRASSQTTVLLRAADRRRLESLATRENVSAGEIIRRALNSYQPLEARVRRDAEEAIVRSALGLLHEALVTANQGMTNTLAKLDALHEELSRLDSR